MHAALIMSEKTRSRETATGRTRHADLLILCARMGFNP